MALSPDEQRRCYLYLGYIQVNRTGVFVGGQPQTIEVVQKLQTSIDSITPNGETTVRNLLGILDGLYAKQQTVDTRFQALAVGSIKTNPKEWQDRMTQYDHFRMQLARTLDVPLDPPGAATEFGAGDSAGSQGPWREP